MKILRDRQEMMAAVRDGVQRAGGLVTAVLAVALTALVVAIAAVVLAVKGGRRVAGA